MSTYLDQYLKTEDLLGPLMPSGSTFADIQTALNLSTNEVVYLQRGVTYSGAYSQISVPAGKALVGVGGGDGTTYGSGCPRLQVTSGSWSTPFVLLNNGAAMRGVFVERTGGSGSGNGFGVQGSGSNIIEEVTVRAWSAATFGIIAGFGGARLMRCHAVNGVSGCGGFRIQGSGDERTLVYGCTAKSNNGIGFQFDGGAATNFSDCTSESNASHGFQVIGSNTNVKIHNCYAASNGGDGFLSAGGNDGMEISDCYSVSNTGWGFITGVPTGSARSRILDTGARANTAGNYSLAAGWLNDGNWAAS